MQDQAELADDIADGLRDQGIGADVACDGPTGIEKALPNPYDVVILDRDLPQVRGAGEVAAKSRRRGRKGGLPRRRSARTLDDMNAMRVPLPETYPVLLGTQVPLPGAEAALVGLAALAVVLVPFLWPLVENFNVMAHEGAHAATGSLLGFSPLGVTLNSDATGGTFFPLAMRGPRAVIITAAGYLGPSTFGLGAAKLIETGHIVAVLWVAIVLLVLLLFLIRKSFGIFSVPVAIALLAVVMRYAHTGLEEVTVYGMTWLLLLSGARVAVADGARASDAYSLWTMTHLPRQLWALVWLASTLLAIAIGGKWLVLRS